MTHHALGAQKGCQRGLSASLAFCALSLGTQHLPPMVRLLALMGSEGTGTVGRPEGPGMGLSGTQRRKNDDFSCWGRAGNCRSHLQLGW